MKNSKKTQKIEAATAVAEAATAVAEAATAVAEAAENQAVEQVVENQPVKRKYNKNQSNMLFEYDIYYGSGDNVALMEFLETNHNLQTCINKISRMAKNYVESGQERECYSIAIGTMIIAQY